MIELGTVKPGSTIRIPFSSFDKDDGSSITMTNYAAADILIYKDGSTTERASTAGFTATTDFDAKTGKHLAVIDLADNTTAGFYSAGSEYLVAIDAVTVDAVTTGGWIARFKIGIPDAFHNTTIATLASQTSFTLTDGPAEDNALLGCVAYIHDVASLVQGGFATVSAYTGATKTVTLTAGASYTVSTTDNISFFPPVNARWIGATAQTGRDLGSSVLLSAGTGAGQLDFTSGVVKANAVQLLGTAWLTPGTAGTPDVNAKLWNGLATVALPLVPTTAGRTLDVSAGGEAGVDWANVGTPGSTVNLSATTVKTLTDAPADSSGITTLLTRIPSGLFTGITSLAQWLGMLAGKQVGNTTARTEIRATGAGSGTFDETTDSAEAVRDNMGTAQTGDSFARIGATGSGLTSLAPASTALSTAQWSNTRAGYLDNLSAGAVALDSTVAKASALTAAAADITSILGLTGTTGVVVAAASKTGYRLSTTGVQDVRDITLVESYAADNVAPTLNQAIFLILQFLTERSITTTTLTVKKLDGSTTAATFTLDSAGSPTSITRTT